MSNYEIKYGDKCFAGVWTGNEYGIGLVIAGEKGYQPTSYPTVDSLQKAYDIADRLNEQLGIDAKKVGEMILRSMRAENVPYFD